MQIGLDPTAYDTHMIRRTKNIRAVQLLLGHTKLESTVRYLGTEVNDALKLSAKRRCEGTHTTGNGGNFFGFPLSVTPE